MQCSTSWAMNHTLRAGKFTEFINPWKEWNTEWNDVNCGNKKWSEDLTITVEWQFKELQSSQKIFFGASPGFEPVASEFVLQCTAHHFILSRIQLLHNRIENKIISHSVESPLKNLMVLYLLNTHMSFSYVIETKILFGFGTKLNIIELRKSSVFNFVWLLNTIKFNWAIVFDWNFVQFCLIRSQGLDWD